MIARSTCRHASTSSTCCARFKSCLTPHSVSGCRARTPSEEKSRRRLQHNLWLACRRMSRKLRREMQPWGFRILYGHKTQLTRIRLTLNHQYSLARLPHKCRYRNTVAKVRKPFATVSSCKFTHAICTASLSPRPTNRLRPRVSNRRNRDHKSRLRALLEIHTMKKDLSAYNVWAIDHEIAAHDGHLTPRRDVIPP